MQQRSTIYWWGSLVGWMVFFQFLAGLSSVVSVQGPWYTGLLKSSLTPPGYVFGIVWTFLYMFLAVYAWSIWQVYKVPVQDRVTLQGVFVVQMLLNLSWSSVFFLWEQVAWALAMIAVMMGLTAYILYKSFQHRITTGYLLLPYFLWLGFAAYLTGTILWLNG